MPIIGRSAPLLFSRNGKKVRNPMRVALSIIAIASSSEKPRPIGTHPAIAGLADRLSRPCGPSGQAAHRQDRHRSDQAA